VAQSLLEELRDRIRRKGPLTFADFMEVALYDPTRGYYATPNSASIDFRTSPSLTEWFGRLIYRALEGMWYALGRPKSFTAIEVGPGAGSLAAAAMGAVEAPFAQSLRWRLVEKFPAVRELQRASVGGLDVPVEWTETLAEGRPVEGCVLANEVLDNFPVHVFEVSKEGPLEVYIALEGDRLIETLGPPSPEALVEQATEPLAYLEEGDRFEVRLGLEDWCTDAARAIIRGYLMVIDYGDVAPDLWIKRPAGSLVTYRGERLGFELLEHLGHQDITAHVNFSALQKAAGNAGFDSYQMRTQRGLLESLGSSQIAQELRHLQKQAEAEGNHAEALHLLGERGRLQSLTAHGGLGDLLVFIASKTAPAYQPGMK
jgi:SAM-dependent MidA family methyltransferase